MNTIVLEVEKPQFAQIMSGERNFILLKAKVAPVPSQRLLIVEEGYTGEEIDTKVLLVHSETGLMKDNYVVSFPVMKIEN